jgi:hypothetical protein
MANKDPKRCAHPGCLCLAAEGSRYCGAFCEGAGDHPSIACDCGHPECSPD